MCIGVGQKTHFTSGSNDLYCWRHTVLPRFGSFLNDLYRRISKEGKDTGENGTR